MTSKLLLFFVMLHVGASSVKAVTKFSFSGFRSGGLELDGNADFAPNGLLRLTNATDDTVGHAFYPDPVLLIQNSTKAASFSFSSTFVFAIIPKNRNLATFGFAFVAAPHRNFSDYSGQTLGLYNSTRNPKATNRFFAVELDTMKNDQAMDIDDNHLGIDIDGMVSDRSATAGYYPHGGAGKFKTLSLASGQAMQVWVDYDGTQKQANVTLAPLGVVRPSTPLLSLQRDLSPIFNKTMYVGFSAATGSKLLTSYYILGWSFRINGRAPNLTISQHPKLPRIGKKPISEMLTLGVPLLSLLSLLMLLSALIYIIIRKRKFAEVLEDWELSYGTHRFKFKDLYIATRGFRDDNLLGVGGFGRVYRGILPSSKMEIAVKRVSHDSRQGIREFVAEIVSIGRLRHRNLVTLLGYCRRKGELLLVYDYMPNGSLDKYLFNQPGVTLNWSRRFRIIKGVASGLLYLHEGWEQVVIHRDVKASNVLLDSEFNGRLGDFGLARLYDHGTDPQTTHLVGTLGYLAPEHTRTGKATKPTDVFAFGAFLLEVATGRRPIEARGTRDFILIDYVFFCWSRGQILDARDPNLGAEFVTEELDLVLKLGLVCSHADPEARPSMRQVVQYLDGDLPIKDLSSSLSDCASGLRFSHKEGFDDFIMSYGSSTDTAFFITNSAVDSVLSGGR